MGLKDKWAQKERALADRQAAEPAPAPPETVKQKPLSADKSQSGSGSGGAHGAVTFGKMAMLEHEVKELRAAAPRLMLDPEIVHPSRWANRHELSFGTTEFAQLKEEIGSAGKNVQPIKVRPLASQTGHYEIVFGHRRHRACLELGLKVEAIVEPVDDQTLFAEMDRENRLRSDLRPFEQGVMYKRALEEGLFPSLRQLSKTLGVDVSAASKAIDIASLPEHVLQAFSSPLVIQYRWGALLKEAVEKDADGVKAMAAALSSGANKLADDVVLANLAGLTTVVIPKNTTVIEGKDGAKATYTQTKKGHVFEINASSLPPEKLQKIKDLIAKLIA